VGLGATFGAAGLGAAGRGATRGVTGGLGCVPARGGVAGALGPPTFGVGRGGVGLGVVPGRAGVCTLGVGRGAWAFGVVAGRTARGVSGRASRLGPTPFPAGGRAGVPAFGVAGRSTRLGPAPFGFAAARAGGPPFGVGRAAGMSRVLSAVVVFRASRMRRSTDDCFRLVASFTRSARSAAVAFVRRRPSGRWRSIRSTTAGPFLRSWAASVRAGRALAVRTRWSCVFLKPAAQPGFARLWWR
jgi:hypothetical protein